MKIEQQTIKGEEEVKNNLTYHDKFITDYLDRLT